MRRRVLYGGTFDPIHTAHVEIARAAGVQLGANLVSLIPAADPPHKPAGAHASAEHRLAMARIAVAEEPRIDVLDVEIRRGGTSYTIDTVLALRDGECRGEQLMLLLGQDSLPLLPTWHRVRELAALIPFAVAPRPGADEPPWAVLAEALGEEPVAGLRARWLRTPSFEISSTDLRLRRTEGRSIHCRAPDPVVDYIEEHGLYRPAPQADSEVC